MRTDGTVRAGALAGVAGAAVYVVSAFVPGTAPKPDDPVNDVVAHFVDKRGALLAASVLGTLAVGLLLWFVGYLRKAIEEADGPGSPMATVTVASWVALLVIASIGAAFQTAIIWRGADTFDPKLVQASFDIANLSLYSLSAGAALLSVLAPTLVIWRTRMLPRWIVAVGALEIVVNIVELAGIASRRGANAAGYAAGVGPLVWVVWAGALSVLLYRARPAAAS